MIYGYPIEATTENWLHEALCEVVRAVDTKVAANEDLPEWPDILPEAHREALKRKHGLKAKIHKFFDDFIGLAAEERVAVTQALREQNNISDLTSCASNCFCLDELPTSIRTSINPNPQNWWFEMV